MADINPQFDRVKGAEWFPLLNDRDIMVLGQGGIGSWTSLLLSRIGCSLTLFDIDIYEEHNMTGQVVGKSGIGKNKAEAMLDMIAELSPACNVACYGRYRDDSPTNDIVICGFDNMAARKTAFKNWKNQFAGEKGAFFQDGRLLAEQLQIYNIPSERVDLIAEYETNHLFNDDEVAEADCTFKQTSHCAAMIASHMLGFLTNWVSNQNSEIPFKQVPFKYEYIIPISLVQIYSPSN